MQKRILVVDDEEMNLVVAKGVLGSYGIQVDTCQSGKEALERCGNTPYHMIFLDHMMPGLDGVETLRRIRETNNGIYRDRPVIALTANTISGAREMFRNEGFSEFVPKPIERSVLERVLNKVLPKECIHYSSAPQINQDWADVGPVIRYRRAEDEQPSMAETAVKEEGLSNAGREVGEERSSKAERKAGEGSSSKVEREVEEERSSKAEREVKEERSPIQERAGEEDNQPAEERAAEDKRSYMAERAGKENAQEPAVTERSKTQEENVRIGKMMQEKIWRTAWGVCTGYPAMEQSLRKRIRIRMDFGMKPTVRGVGSMCPSTV